jgi:hypothetical protein
MTPSKFASTMGADSSGAGVEIGHGFDRRAFPTSALLSIAAQKRTSDKVGVGPIPLKKTGSNSL